MAWMFDPVDTIEKTGDMQLTIKTKVASATFPFVLATTAGHVMPKALDRFDARSADARSRSAPAPTSSSSGRPAARSMLGQERRLLADWQTVLSECRLQDRAGRDDPRGRTQIRRSDDDPRYPAGPTCRSSRACRTSTSRKSSATPATRSSWSTTSRRSTTSRSAKPSARRSTTARS